LWANFSRPRKVISLQNFKYAWKFNYSGFGCHGQNFRAREKWYRHKTLNLHERLTSKGVENCFIIYAGLFAVLVNCPMGHFITDTKLMVMQTKKIFLASSAELAEDREQFKSFIGSKNNDWVKQYGVFIELVLWEDFLDAMSQTRLQDEYDKAIKECDLFVMLFFTKVGQYTEEEFETAFGRFKATNKPFLFTYFKDAEISTGSANKKDMLSLWAFQEKLDGLGHFYTRYKNIDELKYHFNPLVSG
jgi:hypothetical protein